MSYRYDRTDPYRAAWALLAAVKYNRRENDGEFEAGACQAISDLIKGVMEGGK